MKILGIICFIAAIISLISSYFVATDKIKPSKTTQVLLYLIIATALLGSAFRAFTR